MSPLEYFRLLAPEFALLDDSVFNAWTLIAANLVTFEGMTDEQAAMGLALYVAHLIWVANNQAVGGGSASGAIISESEGDLSRTYKPLAGGDTWLGQSPYGQQFLELTRPYFGLGIMTRVGDVG